MAETIQLDPSAIDATRTMVDITSFIKADGVDYGDAAIAAAMADQTFGSRPVDYRIPNRTVKIPLTLRTVDGVSFSTIRTNIQQKVALFQREGGSVMRQIDSTPYYADVVNATLHLGGDWLQAYRSADIAATLELECLPDWYGAEVTLSDHVETTKPELIFTEATINGSYPARTRIIVDNDVATDQHAMIWGVRSRHYSTATTAALAYEAESLQPLDAATKTARSGASGGTVVRHPSLPAGAWCPVLSTNVGGTGYLTHKGSYRVWGRCRGGTLGYTYMRLVWDVADMTNPTTNAVVTPVGANNFYMLDFGSVFLSPSPVGPHRWQGVIQTQSVAQGDSVEIDRLFFQPLDEGAGSLTAIQTDSVLGINQTRSPGTAVDDSGTGTVAWIYPEHASVEDGNGALCFGTATTTHYLKATNYGFSVPTGATISGIKLSISKQQGLPSPAIYDNRVRMVKGGTIQSTDAANTVTQWSNTSWAWTDYGGPTYMWGTTWTPADINNSGFGAVISATIGASAETVYVDVMNITVYYTTSGGFSETPDAVMFASQSAELRTEGMYREDAGGTAFGPVSQVIGDLPRLPPSGLESRPVEVFLKASQGNMGLVMPTDEPDDSIDDVSAQIRYRPSYLFIG